MPVFRVEKTKDYTVMANHHLQDTRLSLKAKGLLSLILSLPEDWDYTVAGLARLSRDGKDAVRSCLDELSEAGYVRRSRTHKEDGTFGGNEYVVYEHPQQVADEPSSENPTMDAPSSGNPTLENPSLENPTEQNTKEQSTKKDIPPVSPASGGGKQKNLSPASPAGGGGKINFSFDGSLQTFHYLTPAEAKRAEAEKDLSAPDSDNPFSQQALPM